MNLTFLYESVKFNIADPDSIHSQSVSRRSRERAVNFFGIILQRFASCDEKPQPFSSDELSDAALAAHVPADVQGSIIFGMRPAAGSGTWLGAAGMRSSIGQTVPGSFAAVSKPKFARKYAFENSRRDLHNALFCTGL